jgi:hypothetical protein
MQEKCKLMEIAFQVEAVQGRIHIEKINGPMLFQEKASPAGADLFADRIFRRPQLAIDPGVCAVHRVSPVAAFTGVERPQQSRLAVQRAVAVRARLRRKNSRHRTGSLVRA